MFTKFYGPENPAGTTHLQKKAIETRSDKLDQYLGGIEHLPPRPTLMIRLMELFQQPDRDIDEIASLMRQDPSLTAEVLRRCNGSFFGNDEPVTDFNEAVFRLGFYEVYRISVATFSVQAMAVTKTIKGLEVEKLWRHSAITAIIGGVLARELEESEGAAFTAGLLHDVGKIVLASAEGARYGELLKQHGDFGTSLNDAEMGQIGFSHGEIGAHLLGRWGVPELICQPVLTHHHETWSGPHERLAAIVSLANQMAHCAANCGLDHDCQKHGLIPAMQLLELSRDELRNLKLAARGDLKRLGALLPK